MSRKVEMPPARRRPMPGMASSTQARPGRTLAAVPETPSAENRSERSRSPRRRSSSSEDTPLVKNRRPAADYGATRLVNFRLPVDLHDRFKKLVRETEEAHPRLRHPSLTELMIALLEEGPSTSDDVAALIRRKRAAENASGA